MLLVEFVAGAVLLTFGAVGALDSGPARGMLYAITRWRRRRRQAQRSR